MVFLIQNTQNRDSKALHLKLDELVRAVRGARNSLVSLEQMSDQELLDLEKKFVQIREGLAKRGSAKSDFGKKRHRRLSNRQDALSLGPGSLIAPYGPLALSTVVRSSPIRIKPGTHYLGSQ